MDVTAMRKADLRMGILLFLFGTAVLIGATDFPLTDSYAGVRNVWYVSPALLPLIVSGLILILSLALIANALVTIGWAGAGESFRIGSLDLTDRRLRFALIIAVIVTYVYVAIPGVDFLIASTTTLLSLIGGFWFGGRRPVALMLVLVVLAALVQIVLAAVAGSGPLLDSFSALAGVVQFYALWRLAAGDRLRQRRAAATVAIALGVSLFLCIAFKYGLLVPLPHEGVVMEFMNSLYYGLR